MAQSSILIEYWKPHLNHIEKSLKAQPFWKTALFSLMCLQRQWPVYERLSVGREWGNTKAVAKVLERFWKAIPTGYSIGDSYWGIVNDSIVVVEEDWDALASDFIVTLQRLFDVFESKDKNAACMFASRNVDFLDVFLDFEATGYQGIHPLMEMEKEFQLHLIEIITPVPTAGKIACIQTCHEIETTSILADFWFKDYPDYKPLKKRANKAVSDGLRFRTTYQMSCPTNKNYKCVRENEEKVLLTLEDYKASGYCSEQFLAQKEGANKWDKAKSLIDHYSREDYLSFYSDLCFDYFSLAQDNYLSDKPMEKTLQLLYQGAQCAIISKKLYDKTTQKERELRKLQYPNWGFNFEAEHQAMLVYLYEDADFCMNSNSSPYIHFIQKMLSGQYDKAANLLEKCSASADPIYRGADLKMIQALYSQNADDIRKSVLQMIRAVRAMEDLYLEVFPKLPILVMRCANQMGLDIKPIEVSELPKELLGIHSPFHAATSQPFGVERIVDLI